MAHADRRGEPPSRVEYAPVALGSCPRLGAYVGPPGFGGMGEVYSEFPFTAIGGDWPGKEG